MAPRTLSPQALYRAFIQTAKRWPRNQAGGGMHLPNNVAQNGGEWERIASQSLRIEPEPDVFIHLQIAHEASDPGGDQRVVILARCVKSPYHGTTNTPRASFNSANRDTQGYFIRPRLRAGQAKEVRRLLTGSAVTFTEPNRLYLGFGPPDELLKRFLIALDAIEIAKATKAHRRRLLFTPAALTPPPPSFKSEFAGTRAPSGPRVSGPVEVDHGKVIKALRDALVERGHEPANDQARDLYLHDGKGRMTVLFEAKTDLDPGSIYKAIGQLLYHSHGHDPRPRLVMVLPAPPNNDTAAVLAGLGIVAITYQLAADDTVAFAGLDAVLPVSAETNFR